MKKQRTRCPKCSTAFYITNAQLQQANGYVRCGSCLEVFEASLYMEKVKPKTVSISPVEPAAVSQASVTRKVDTKTAQTKPSFIRKEAKASPATQDKTTRPEVTGKDSSISPHLSSTSSNAQIEPISQNTKVDNSMRNHCAEANLQTAQTNVSSIEAPSGQNNNSDSKVEDQWISDLIAELESDKSKSNTAADINVGNRAVEKTTLKKESAHNTAIASPHLKDTKPVSKPTPQTTDAIAEKKLAIEKLQQRIAQQRKQKKVTVSKTTEDSKSNDENTVESLIDGSLASAKNNAIPVTAKTAETQSIKKEEPTKSVTTEETQGKEAQTEVKETKNKKIKDKKSKKIKEKNTANTSPKEPLTKTTPTHLEPEQVELKIEHPADTTTETISQEAEIPSFLVEKKHSKSILWFGLSAIAGVALFAQYLVWNFEKTSYSEMFRPLLVTSCGYINCQVPLYENISQLKTEQLIIRELPNASGKVQIDALIVNKAAIEQIFPTLRIIFKDELGKTVNQLDILPNQYLTGDLSQLSSMPPQTPIHIQLNIVHDKPLLGYQLEFIKS